MDRKCLFCKKTLVKQDKESKTQYINRKYCNRKCYSDSHGTIKTNCNNCGKPVSRNLAEVKKSKSGKLFCSRSCSSSVANKLRNGAKNPNYLNGKGSYRQKALNYYKNKCEICGYDIIDVLEVHHIDSNRNNNNLSNLKILCPTHHKEYQYGLRTAYF